MEQHHHNRLTQCVVLQQRVGPMQTLPPPRVQTKPFDSTPHTHAACPPTRMTVMFKATIYRFIYPTMQTCPSKLLEGGGERVEGGGGRGEGEKGRRGAGGGEGEQGGGTKMSPSRLKNVSLPNAAS